MNVLFVCLGIIVLNFIFLFKLSGFFVGKGSDHAFYDYYIQLIKENKNRFFSHFPNFLNKTPITDPQFFFGFISYFSASLKKKISLFLNPVVLTILFSMVLILVQPLNNYLNDSFFIPKLFVLIVTTPQYFHGQNSRIYGLSARGVGLGLFFLFMMFILKYQQAESGYIYFFLAVVCGYLIWGVSLFAQQAILFFSLVFLVLFNNYLFILATIISLMVFVMIHPGYAKNYFINRWRYLLIYSNYLADRFILKHRYSVWRDWFYDFWFKKEKKITTKFSYVYTNSLFILIFLNPFVLVALYGYFSPVLMSNVVLRSLYTFSLNVNLAGVIIFILTSFRLTRFLGEPERYVEMIIPFSAIAGMITISNMGSEVFVYLLIIAFILINIVQLLLFVYLRRTHPQEIALLKESIVEKIENSIENKSQINFFSNNQDWTKFFLNTEWRFIYFYPTVYEIGGVHIAELIQTYPFFDSKGSIQIAKNFNINFFLQDLNSEVEVEELKKSCVQVEEIMSETSFKLYRIIW